MSEGKVSNKKLLPIKIYGALYLILMVCYIVGLIGNGIVVPTDEWVKSAFPKGGDSLSALQADANVDMAEFRADMDYAFETKSNVIVQIDAGDKVTLPVAAEIAIAVQEDAQKNSTDAKEMIFPYKEMKIYKLGWFWNINWAYTFTVYNLLGMFMGLYIGLKAPIGKMLGDSAAETAEALANARAAKKEAGELKQKYEALLSEVELERAKLAESIVHEEEQEKIKQDELAAAEAKAIIRSVKSSINADIEIAATRLKSEIAAHAVAEARKILAEKLDEDLHKEAVSDFITQLEKAE